MTPLERLEQERWLPPSWAVDAKREDVEARLLRERPRKPQKRVRKPRKPSSKETTPGGDMSTFYGSQSARAREPETKPVRTRCCGRCKTPYGCGNPSCKCHQQVADEGSK